MLCGFIVPVKELNSRIAVVLTSRAQYQRTEQEARRRKRASCHINYVGDSRDQKWIKIRVGYGFGTSCKKERKLIKQNKRQTQSAINYTSNVWQYIDLN